MSIDVSVVIPVYKAEPYIKRCIEGLLAQDFPLDRTEVLLVDNNSPDQSVAIIREFEPLVHLIHESKQGAYAARNCALREARGRVIAFTDPDCVPEHDWLSTGWQALQRPGTQIVIGRVYPPEGSEALRLLHLYVHHRHRYIFNGHDPRLYYGHTNNLVASREAVYACCPFEEHARGGDTIFVQHVISRFGIDAVDYHPEMRVMHLEVENTRQFLHKAFLYGRSFNKYSKVVDTRAVTFSERWKIWRDAVKEERLAMTQQAKMWGILGLGALSFTWGNVRGAFTKQPTAPAKAGCVEKVSSHG